MLLALLLSLAAPQDAPALTLDGAALAAPSATISPLGWLEVSGRPEQGPALRFRLTFPELEWPAAGEHALPAGAIGATVAMAAEAAPAPGKLVVEAISVSRAAFRFAWKDGDTEHTLAADLAPRLHVPTLQTRPIPESKPPADRPDRDDVVFAALGNAGTGLPGQRQVAESLAALAASGPLDFVLMLGNNFPPRGLADVSDPRFVSDFVQAYDKRRLDVLFHVVLGPADHLGQAMAQASRGVIDPRWTLPDAAFEFEQSVRGKRIAFFGVDSELLTGPIPRPATRSALRAVTDGARISTADWKIVFAHDPLVSTGAFQLSERQRILEERCFTQLRNAKVDLVLCAAGGALRLSKPAHGIPIVVAGGGGGPEMGREPEIVPGTVFAWGGGGFAWFRFDGNELELSFRAADGRVLYTHVFAKS